jgi:hypothetical protein
MLWLMRRILMMWVALALISATVLLIARVNHAPNRLQALGFDVCDGEPCFRGIKPGMDWAEIPKRLPSVKYDGRFLVLTVNRMDIQRVLFQPSTDNAKVEAIHFGPEKMKVYPITPGAMVARYGPPCHINLVEMNSRLLAFETRYPGILVRYGNAGDPTRVDVRLQFNMPAYEFQLTELKPTLCKGISTNSGLWHGFASANMYHARNRRALATR